jgi:hypothetical protein
MKKTSLVILISLEIYGASPVSAMPKKETPAGQGEVCAEFLLPNLKLDFDLLNSIPDNQLRHLIAFGSQPNGLKNWARRNRVPLAQAQTLFSAFIQNLKLETDIGSSRLNGVANQVRTSATDLIAGNFWMADFIFRYILTESAEERRHQSDNFETTETNTRKLLSIEPVDAIDPALPLTRMFRTYRNHMPDEGSKK